MKLMKNKLSCILNGLNEPDRKDLKIGSHRKVDTEPPLLKITMVKLLLLENCVL